MKILFDATGFELSLAGMSKSTSYLYEACIEKDSTIQFIGFTRGCNLSGLLEEIPMVKLSKNKFNLKYTRGTINELISKTGADVIHFPYNGNIPSKLMNIKKIMTFHDVLPLEMPVHLLQEYRHVFYLYKPYYWFKRKQDVNIADVIFTDSEYSKRQIIKYFTPKKEPIVLPFGPTIRFPNQDLKIVIPKYQYFMYVGGYEPRKGIKDILKAFLNICKTKKISYKLILVGKQKFIDLETDLLLKQCTEIDIIIQIGFVSDSELAFYYAHALGLIYLSKYEGFGLPPLEAMYLGCPVITTKYTSLPEICGTAALYVEPDNVSEVSSAIDFVATNENMRLNMTQEGKIQSLKFSWEKAADIFLNEIYSTI
ncbi:mannosyltransferase [Spirochaetia bacterium]|nr:mannosyltransferase [Spirochaetia bacterium]